MQALSDLIETKKQHYVGKIVDPTSAKEESSDWVSAKRYVEDLKANYREILAEALERNEYIKKFQWGKFTNIVLSRVRFGHEVVLEIIEDETKAIRRVTYMTTNALESTAYIREIV